MAITYQSSTIGAAGGNTTVAVPSGVTAGDCIIIIAGQTGEAAPQDPTVTGFTVLDRTVNTASPYSRTHVFWKIATAADTGTYAIVGTAGFSQWICARYSGTHQGNPIDGYTMAASDTASPHSNPGVTPACSGSVVVYGSNNYFGTAPAWSGSTARQAGLVQAFNDKTGPTINTPTGALTCSTASQPTTSIVFLLRPPDETTLPPQVAPFALTGPGSRNAPQFPPLDSYSGPNPITVAASVTVTAYGVTAGITVPTAAVTVTAYGVTAGSLAGAAAVTVTAYGPTVQTAVPLASVTVTAYGVTARVTYPPRANAKVTVNPQHTSTVTVNALHTAKVTVSLLHTATVTIEET